MSSRSAVMRSRRSRRSGTFEVGWSSAQTGRAAQDHLARSAAHTLASHLVMQGVPRKAVQELMGHATIEMTLRYSHLSPEVGRSAVQLLDRHSHSMATRTTPLTN